MRSDDDAKPSTRRFGHAIDFTPGEEQNPRNMPGPPSIFESPRPTSPPASLRDYIQPNLGHGLRIWWAFYWPTALAGIIAAIGFNTALRLGLEVGVISFDWYGAILWIARFDTSVFYYIAAFFVMAYILRKNFRSFRVGLLSKYGAEGAQRLQPTLRRTARVWWTFSWRAVVYRIIAALVASIPLAWIMGLLSAFLRRPAVPFANLAVQIMIDGAIGMFVIYSSILDEDIADFRVALLPRPTTPQPAVIPSVSPTPANQ